MKVILSIAIIAGVIATTNIQTIQAGNALGKYGI